MYRYDVTYDKKQFIKACSDVICAGAGEEWWGGRGDQNINQSDIVPRMMEQHLFCLIAIHH